MLKKNLSILAIILSFILIIIFFVPHDKEVRVIKVLSPIELILKDEIFKFSDLQTFDSKFTEKNAELSKKLNITEIEAFVLGNLAKNWSTNLLEGRFVYRKANSDIVYNKHSYRTKFLYSGFCLVDSKPYYLKGFNRKLREIRKVKYKVLDLDTNKIYNLDEKEVCNLNNFILIRKSHLPSNLKAESYSSSIEKGNIKVIVSDSTSKYVPDRNCATDICKEILYNINAAQKTVDMAIYGYSTVPAIETALRNASKRGVKLRLVYDLDNKGKNIYSNTSDLTSLIQNNNNDGNSQEAQSIMHNKFYIFDDKILITGSANLSHTDMSGFNTNSIIVINSDKIAKIYKNEFNQMYEGKFHSEKRTQFNNKNTNTVDSLKVYFSPQDKSLTNAVLPLIKNAKEYIYIPTFVLTEKRVTEELINAKNRGVDVKIIMDALNASIKHSKHKDLRTNGIMVKTENYAGKMHSKSMIVDDKYTIIGSMNFSNSGENKNDENLIVINDAEIAQFYKKFFLYQWEKIDNIWLTKNVRAESKESIGSCFDGVDNNYDGLIDSNDPACK